jgi:hypothetical protein
LEAAGEQRGGADGDGDGGGGGIYGTISCRIEVGRKDIDTVEQGQN